MTQHTGRKTATIATVAEMDRLSTDIVWMRMFPRYRTTTWVPEKARRNMSANERRNGRTEEEQSAARAERPVRSSRR